MFEYKYFYKIKILAKVGLELKTPGLRDQCSNHWTNDAHALSQPKLT